MAINQNDYHYWEGFFKGLLPNEILKLSDEDFQILYEDFVEKGLETEYLEDLIGDEDSSYTEGKVLKQIFKDFLYEIDSKYFKSSTIKEINLFRSLSVDRIEEIDFDDKGICWTYNLGTLYNYIEEILVPNKNYLVRFYGTTSIENIDWIESFFLYINYSTEEKELRVYDSQKVFLKGYVNIDYSTMIEYSKDGETSYLLEGTVTKEDFLKERESLLKKFLYIPQTNRYDYDGDLNKNDLSILVSEDKDGFIINFGKVTGDFNCSDLGLKSLKGAPREVGGIVGGSFSCSNNKLISLEGAPQKVGGDFYCRNNPDLNSLDGIGEVRGKIYKDF